MQYFEKYNITITVAPCDSEKSVKFVHSQIPRDAIMKPGYPIPGAAYAVSLIENESEEFYVTIDENNDLRDKHGNLLRSSGQR